MPNCGSCRRAILWAVTPAGAKAPIDIDPVANGTVLVLKPEVLAGEFLAVVLSGDALEVARKSGRLRVNHWATCPDKAQWRAKQQAKAEGS